MKKNILICAFIISYAVFVLLPDFSSAILGDLYSSETLEVVIGEAQPLKVNNPRQVKIGNPALLDVVGASRIELLLSGLEEGQTKLTVVDEFGSREYLVRVVKESLDKIHERVGILLQASGFTNLMLAKGEYERKVFVLGEVSAEKSDSLGRALEPVRDHIIDFVKRKEDILPSVEIDVSVYEVKKEVLDQLGFKWSTAAVSEDGESGQVLTYAEPSENKKSLKSLVGDMLLPTRYYKMLKTWGRSESLSMNFDFLESKSEVRTLARPKLVVQSGKEASFVVGGEQPIVTGSTTTVSAGTPTTTYDIEYKEFGVRLNFKPEVKEDDIIQISLETEISEVDKGLALELPGAASTPGLKKSTTKTELTVLDGQTVLLAGLIKTEDTEGRSKVKGLGSVPFIGALFRSKSIDRSDREIVISLKPTIIWPHGKKGAAELRQAAVNTERKSQQDVALLSKEIRMRDDDPLYEYSRLTQSLINSKLKYPRELRRDKIEGVVKLSLHLLSSGQLLGVIVMKSSGNELLDLAAQETVKELAPYPAFPPEVNLKELWIDIPIAYRID